MHREALTPNGQGIFPLLAKFKDFYLAGGTALALQIGHRLSVDFDLFTPEKLAANVLGRAEIIFTGKTVQPLTNNRDELTILADRTKITFLHYPFPILRDLVELAGQRMLSVPELSATKAYTIGRRGTFKDYVDLYFTLSEKHITFSQLLKLAEKKYDEMFNPRLFLEQLVYLEDIQDTQIQFLKNPVAKLDIQKYFEQEIKKLNI